ncbi:hypothetical protein CR513_36631, partial [Mucuna pruriens]
MIFKGQPSRHKIDGATINLYLRGIDTNNSKIARPNKINYPFNKQISTIGRVDNNWKIVDNKIVKSEYPPQQGIIIQLSNNLEIEASPYKDIK